MKKTGRKSKKLLAILMSALMVGSMIVPASAAKVTDFTDVPESAWYYNAVKYVADKGIFAGMSATKFEPQTILTRAMFVQTMANFTVNYDSNTEVGKQFNDIKPADWFYNAANWASEQLLVSGTGDGDFSPRNNITREQAATILYSYAMRTGGNSNIDDINSTKGFDDATKVSDWAQGAVRWAVDKKIMAGVGENKLDPKGYLTRAQAAQLFTNVKGIIDDEPNIYTKGFAKDVDTEVVKTFSMTYSELVTKFGAAKLEESSFQGKLLSFKNNTEALYFFLEKDLDTSGIPEATAHADYISTSIKNVLPEIVGKTFGEAIKLTDGNLHIYYDDERFPEYIAFDGNYFTESYMIYIMFYGTKNIEGGSPTSVEIRTNY